MRPFRLATIVLYGVVSLWSIFVLMPVTWMLFAAFKTRREIFTDPLGLPDTLELRQLRPRLGRSGSAPSC